jgi:RNA polymerase sigma-70 factor, ECF subfamily
VPDADADRFTRLYALHYTRVLAYAMRRAPADVAREAVDEAFLIAWRRLSDVPQRALPWLFVVVRNVITDQFRSARRADALVTEVARLEQATAGRDVSEAVTERAAVLQVLAGLSERDREALMLTVWDGLNHREAAAVAGCAAATFTVRVHRARRRLQDALARIDGLSTLTSTLVQEAR